MEHEQHNPHGKKSRNSKDMLDYDELVDQVLGYLKEHMDKNYCVAVMIVGSPGSGKSSIAVNLQKKLNERFERCISSRDDPISVSSKTCNEFLHEDIPVASTALVDEVLTGFFGHVEDLGFKPRKFTDGDGSTIVFGRGGLPNSIRISSEVQATPLPVQIAQVVPMDGFHLSRAHLDHFKDPEVAHARRGSPSTFDSNSYLQLCRFLSKFCARKPMKPSRTDEDLMNHISETFQECPSIYFPGFDHSLKDPVRNQHCVNCFTRVLIFEGLYLMLDKENWSQVYPTIAEAVSPLIFQIDIDEEVTETRVAKRHVESGLVDSIEAGIEKFRSNDLLNSTFIKAHSLHADKVYTIRND